MPRFTFFIGKGGVGKTTISSAYALNQAARHSSQSFLLLSTDPAHSLSDALQVKLGRGPTRLRCKGELSGQELDATRQIRSFLGFEQNAILELLDRGSFFNRDELEQLLGTTLPGMGEVAALLAIHDLVESDFDEVIIDTAPMGHAIRLFQMPEHFARFLKVLETAAARDATLARHFGSLVRHEPVLDRWSRIVERIHQVLSPESSRLVLITTPEPFSLNQSRRSAVLFGKTGLHTPIGDVVLNRAVAANSTCPRCMNLSIRSRDARRFVKRHFPHSKLFIAEDPGGPIFGLDALRKFGTHVFEGRKLSPSVVAKPAPAKAMKLQPATWPSLRTPLSLTVGKGGVGKTTVSAALAYHSMKAKSEALTICSIDPAPSLSDVFGTRVGQAPRPVLGSRQLQAVELDAAAQFRQWADMMRDRVNEALRSEEGGVHLDLSLDRKLLVSLLDVIPPGVDQIFSIFGILDLVDSRQRVVVDMAPTGHALEVLRTPERLLAWARMLLKTLAAHRTLPLTREIAVEIAKISQKVRGLAISLRDRTRCSLAG